MGGNKGEIGSLGQPGKPGRRTDNMKIQNMTSANGNSVPNQFIIDAPDGLYFQSYKTIIAFKPSNGGPIQLDARKWDCSPTTGKYRNQFLGETIKETRAKIKSGDYLLVNLNK